MRKILLLALCLLGLIGMTTAVARTDNACLVLGLNGVAPLVSQPTNAQCIARCQANGGSFERCKVGC